MLHLTLNGYVIAVAAVVVGAVVTAAVVADVAVVTVVFVLWSCGVGGV